MMRNMAAAGFFDIGGLTAVKAVVACWSFVFGATIASFLNVVIWRAPRGESIVRPSSHCPKCGSPIKWYHNIPIVSWLALRGKCASCAEPISPRYPLVEFLGGALFLAAFFRYSYAAPAAWIWISLMIAGSFIDFDHYLLPDFVTVGGMVYGVALSLASCALVGLGVVRPESVWFVPSPAMSLLGLASGAGVLWLLGFVGSKIVKREAMGMGDVLLLGAIGAMFGPVAALFSLVASSIVGSVAGLVSIAVSKSKRVRYRMIPFGPYLCIGCVAWMFAGDELVAAYLRMLGLGG